MKRVIKRTAAVVLAITVLCGTVAGSYQNAQASGIVAGGAIVGTLEEILLSFGIFLLPSAMADQAQSSDWWYSEDGNAALKPYYDDLASEYEKERFKVINGGGGDPQPSPTPVPEQKPEIQPTPIPQVKPGEIPTFDELVAPALAGGAISWASGAWDTMAKAVGNLWDKLIDNTPPTTNLKGNPLATKGKCVGKVVSTYNCNPSNDGYHHVDTYYLYDNSVTGTSNLGFSVTTGVNNGVTSLSLYSGKLYENNSFNTSSVSYYGLYVGASISDYFGSSWSIPVDASRYSNVTDTSYSYQFYVPYLVDGIYHGSDAKPATKEEIWVHPDLQETYQNNGKLEYPQEAPQPLQYPSAENLADLAKKLNPEVNPDYSPEIAPNYVQELIQKLQKDPSVNPDPDPNPAPNPGTNPQPTTAPLPTVNPTGTPENPTPEEEASPYKADLREVFPFCIPFDLIHLLKVFEADAEAPVFEFPLDIELDNPWTCEKVVDYHHTFELDMSDYEPVIKILRIFQVVFFIIALMLITRQQMIKG